MNGAETEALDEERRLGAREEGLHRGVVPLDVPDGQHPRARARQSHERGGLFHRGGQRLLDEHVEAALQKEPAQLPVGARRGRDDDGLGGLGDFLRSREDAEAALARHLFGPPLVVIVDAHEGDARQLRRDAGMVAAEVPDTDDGEAHGRETRGVADRRGSARHLMKPRSLALMNRTSSSTSGWPGSSSAIRSSAWLVLSFDFTRMR